jgi:hypothetical protein
MSRWRSLGSWTRFVDAGDRGITAAVLACAAILVRIATPGDGSIYPPCVFKWLTGWDCAGCGSLRALRAVTDGDLARAWSLNPLFVFFVFGFSGALLLRAAHVRRPEVPPQAYRLIPVAIVLFWIGRNL